MQNENDQRAFFRLMLNQPVHSYMRIVEVEGEKIESNGAQILTNDISIGGLQFESELSFPIESIIAVMQFEVPIFDQVNHFKGHIVWKEEIEGGKYRYGVRFNNTSVRFLRSIDWLQKNEGFYKK